MPCLLIWLSLCNSVLFAHTKRLRIKVNGCKIRRQFYGGFWKMLRECLWNCVSSADAMMFMMMEGHNKKDAILEICKKSFHGSSILISSVQTNSAIHFKANTSHAKELNIVYFILTREERKRILWQKSVRFCF